MRIFKTKAYVTTLENIDKQKTLSEIGIESEIEDSEISLVDVFIPYDNILFSERCNNGYIVTLKNGIELECKHNPFDCIEIEISKN